MPERTSHSSRSSLHAVFSVFAYTDCNKRGQTSRPVVGAAIQTSYKSEAKICDDGYILGCFIGTSYLANRQITLWYGRIVISFLSSMFNLLVP